MQDFLAFKATSRNAQSCFITGFLQQTYEVGQTYVCQHERLPFFIFAPLRRRWGHYSIGASFSRVFVIKINDTNIRTTNLPFCRLADRNLPDSLDEVLRMSSFYDSGLAATELTVLEEVDMSESVVDVVARMQQKYGLQFFKY